MDASVIPVIAVIVAVISAGVAIWQGVTSRSQLRLAQDTERRTSAALDEIRRVTGETKQLTQDVKTNIDERITRILDTKLAAEQASQATSNAFGEALMGKLMEGINMPKPPSSGGVPPASGFAPE